MLSGYQKDFVQHQKSSLLIRKQEAFNLEKESKIINPHKMEASTQHQMTFTGHEVSPKKKERSKH
jgi:hypothetical protein